MAFTRGEYVIDKHIRKELDQGDYSGITGSVGIVLAVQGDNIVVQTAEHTVTEDRMSWRRPDTDEMDLYDEELEANYGSAFRETMEELAGVLGDFTFEQNRIGNPDLEEPKVLAGTQTMTDEKRKLVREYNDIAKFAEKVQDYTNTEVEIIYEETEGFWHIRHTLSDRIMEDDDFAELFGKWTEIYLINKGITNFTIYELKED